MDRTHPAPRCKTHIANRIPTDKTDAMPRALALRYIQHDDKTRAESRPPCTARYAAKCDRPRSDARKACKLDIEPMLAQSAAGPPRSASNETPRLHQHQLSARARSSTFAA